ncbi:MAG TPA: hypothetical protein VFL71_08565, partial [Actinomycetes bacterium]|nr:hypothetical protein [Actinomycetes bacterium]
LLAACDHHPRLKVCMDTCHAQAAGYDLGDPAGAAKALDELFATLGDRVVQQSPRGGEKAKRGSNVRLLPNLL